VLSILLAGCSDPPPRLRLPIACDVGADCWITSRPDTQPGPGFRAHDGGTHTYDGHDGTDLSVRDVGQAVATWVLAPSGGVVARLRDGVNDGELLARGVAAVDGEECGNGVVLDVSPGWEVHLCHLLRGSVAVTVGQAGAAGDPLGRVGWSGAADHPHVHVRVRRDGRDVDPFSGRYLDDGTNAAPGPLWVAPTPTPTAMDALAWAGFDAGPRPAEDGWPIDGGRGRVPASAPSLVLGVFLWRPEEGDIVRIEIQRPDGTAVRSEAVQPRDRPRQTWYLEQRWSQDRRPVGLWTAHVVWERDGRTGERWTSTVLE
jgi:murein DD-endopeptidase MepM/ murein hydrolase activator NlpD